MTVYMYICVYMCVCMYICVYICVWNICVYMCVWNYYQCGFFYPSLKNQELLKISRV